MLLGAMELNRILSLRVYLFSTKTIQHWKYYILFSLRFLVLNSILSNHFINSSDTMTKFTPFQFNPLVRTINTSPTPTQLSYPSICKYATQSFTWVQVTWLSSIYGLEYRNGKKWKSKLLISGQSRSEKCKMALLLY